MVTRRVMDLLLAQDDFCSDMETQLRLGTSDDDMLLLKTEAVRAGLINPDTGYLTYKGAEALRQVEEFGLPNRVLH